MDSKLQSALRLWLVGELSCGFKENHRPDWLITSLGERCELDFFIEEMRLAVEVQGAQHYRYTPHFHDNYDGFLAQQRRDEFKSIVCAAVGIRLILIHSENDFATVKNHIIRYQDVVRPCLDGITFNRLKLTARRFTTRWTRNTKRLDRYRARLAQAGDPNSTRQVEFKIQQYERSLIQLLSDYRPQILSAMAVSRSEIL